MGILLSCCRPSTSDSLIPQEDMETRRRRQMEAAEKRRQENENRGIKNLERIKRQQQKQIDMEKRQEEAARQDQSTTLKWQTNA